MSHESGTLCSFNLENKTTFRRIREFDPLAYATSLLDVFMPPVSSWQIIYHLAIAADYVTMTTKGKQASGGI